MITGAQVTIIVPVYNGEKYLEETLLSLIDTQAFTESKIILVNDGSSDGTNQIIQKYKNRVEIINQKNQGQAQSINNALKITSTPFCSIVNCDDPIINPKIFNISLKEFNKNKEIVVTYPNWKMIDENSQILKEVEVPKYSREELIGNFNCLVGPGAVFKVTPALSIGGWNARFRFVPDYDFWLRMSNLGGFVKIDEYLASWRNHSDSISVKSKGPAMAKEHIEVMQNFLKDSKLEQRLQKKAEANSLYSAALLSAFNSKINGRKLFILAFKKYPLVLKKKSLKSIIFLLTYPISAYFINLNHK